MMSSKCSVFYTYSTSEYHTHISNVRKPRVVRATILVSVALDDLTWRYHHNSAECSQINIFGTTSLKYSFLKCLFDISTWMCNTTSN